MDLLEEDISNIFAALHDGCVDGCAGNHQEMWLKIGCTYLAELIDNSFDSIYLNLSDVTSLYFEVHGGSKVAIDSTTDLVQLDIELLYSKVESGCIKVDCTKGILYLNCSTVEVFNLAKAPISKQAFFDLAELYWSNVGKR